MFNCHTSNKHACVCAILSVAGLMQIHQFPQKLYGVKLLLYRPSTKPCAYVSMYIYTYMHSMYIYIYIYIQACVYIYIYIY